MNYSNIFGSNFPNEPIPVGTKKDVDLLVKSLIVKYYDYINAGDITSANTLYQENKELLEPYIINSAYFNRLEEEMYNLGVALISSMETIISDNEPTGQSVNACWLEDYE